MDIMTTLFDEEVNRRFYLRVEREAKKANSEEIARNMIGDGISYEKISAYTGLSVSEIENFARNTK